MGKNITTKTGCHHQDHQRINMEWISIYDQMPSLNKQVLLFTKNGCFCGNRYIDEKPRKTKWFDGDLTGWEVNNEAVDEDEMVTHWMPLPAPPEDCETQKITMDEDGRVTKWNG